MAPSVFSIASDHSAPTWLLEAGLLAAWVAGDSLYTVTDRELHRHGISSEEQSTVLITFSGPVSATFLEENTLTVLIQTNGGVASGSEGEFRILTVNLTDFTATTVKSFSTGHLEAPWIIRSNFEEFEEEFWLWCPTLRGADIVFVVGSGQVTIATNGVQTCQQKSGLKRRCHFQRRFLKPRQNAGMDFSVDCFGDLVALLRCSRGIGLACSLLESDITEILLTSGPGDRLLFILTEIGELWRFSQAGGSKRVLHKVKIINLYLGTLLAVTVDNAVYSFSGSDLGFCQSVTALLPKGGNKNSEVVRAVEASAGEIGEIGGTSVETKLELNQLKILHIMLDNKRTLCQSKVIIGREFREGREVQIEITNVCGHEFIGKFWRFKIELKKSGDSQIS